MTTSEFKEKYPHLAHLEGNELWNAMEDSMFEGQNTDPNEPIELSEEDEIEYQKALEYNNTQSEWPISNYTRKFWLYMDKRLPVPIKPTMTAQFIIFDVSNPEPDKE